jgi:uncharacterized protein (DUF952 family)
MIYHITTEEAWISQENQSDFAPAEFVKEGFVHCCDAGQVDGVLKRYFAGRPNLVMLHINESKLDQPLRYEGSTELFPHIYGKINKAAVEKVSVILSASSQ